MHFKKLEIVGFKSFLNKTKLKFEPGVTAVVGPNGCGKSNIVDAIKWVLGEQSPKSMRSTAMGDVIFNGTERQDPVNVAEVSLTLSNTDRSLPVDYDELTISRRLYRSGESEYLLNKTPVRLADVRSLLMGTGIGTSSYSIVEQGRMDMILSSKPEERRHVFEEASGITRYKSKKREALLKLDRTKENLLRISDIVREVERQIKSIERQARKAERYKARFEELKDMEVKLSYKKYKELTTDDSSLDDENVKLNEKRDDLSSEIGEMITDLGRLKEEYTLVLRELQASQNDVMRLSSEIDKNKHVAEVNEERIQELQKSVERLDWEIEEATERKESLNSRVEGLEVRFNDVSGKRNEKDEALNAAQDNVRELAGHIEQNRIKLQNNREKTVDIVSEQTQTKNDLIKVNADTQNRQSRLRRLKLERTSVEAEKQSVSEDLSSIEGQVESVSRALESKREEVDVFNREYADKQQLLTTLNADKQQKEKRLNEIKPRRQFLEKLIEEREGVSESVKDIIKRSESGDPVFEGVHGILSELVNVRENYEESMESILADAAHAVVVEDLAVAERVTSFLSDNAMGSVNFVILEELRRMASGGGSDARKGALEDVTHVLAAQEEYSSALKALLFDTFVAGSPDAAKIFMDDNSSFNGRIIGEKGEVYRWGLRRSRNYSAKETIPLFGRKEKVKELLEEERVIGEKVRLLEGSITELEQWLRDSSAKKGKLETELRERQLEFADVSSKKNSIKEKFNSLGEEMLILDTDIEEETEAIGQLQSEKERLEARLVELELEASRLQQLVEEAQEIIQDCTRKREETFFCMSDIKAELFALRKEEENLSENLEREKESCSRVFQGVEEKRSRVKESGDRIKALDDEIKELKERNLEGSAEAEVKGREISDREERKDSLEQEISEKEITLKGKEHTLEDLRDLTRDIDIKTKEVEYRRDALVEKIMNAYKVNISEMTMEIEEGTDWEDMVSRIKEFKEQLDKMGEVSLGAVEEHKQLEERYQFLIKQSEDLTNGRDALLQAIQKINRTTRKMFMETFEKIQKEFNDYFRMLFNGGKAELLLEDESNVLECGIDISVRPPGKKLHNIMQLSGGEKAMTAIALIFAIFKVNPSPFCVLDEIDAPLDESNIVRFCRVLQEFLKLSQFVIVTHNRMTIQLADVLYGITMEEKGVSKIVSVKFTEEKEMKDEVEIPASA
ncbi:MAG: chromosome segregation protein SMC [Candidatus Tantalella remota]|nr:chromosome segregation protein SMC [Candidatus Tantalella remota]